jgi:hypothetical protein
VILDDLQRAVDVDKRRVRPVELRRPNLLRSVALRKVHTTAVGVVAAVWVGGISRTAKHLREVIFFCVVVAQIRVESAKRRCLMLGSESRVPLANTVGCVPSLLEVVWRDGVAERNAPIFAIGVVVVIVPECGCGCGWVWVEVSE